MCLRGRKIGGRVPAELGRLTNLTKLDLSVNELEGRSRSRMFPSTRQALRCDRAHRAAARRDIADAPTARADARDARPRRQQAWRHDYGRYCIVREAQHTPFKRHGPQRYVGVAPTLHRGERGGNWGARARERRALTDCSCRALVRCAGPIPESIGNLTSLQGLYLQYNKLQGTCV